MRPTARKAPRSRGWDGAKPALRFMQSRTQQEVGPGLWAATRAEPGKDEGLEAEEAADPVPARPHSEQ